MQINTFWKILLKAGGLWLLYDCLYLIPQLFNATLLLSDYPHEGDIRISLYISLLVFIIYMLIIWLLLFKTQSIIHTLRLDRNFLEDNIDTNISDMKLMSAIVMILGGYLFVSNLPGLVREIVAYVQQEALISDFAGIANMAYYFLASLAGYLILSNARRIAAFLQKEEQ